MVVNKTNGIGSGRCGGKFTLDNLSFTYNDMTSHLSLYIYARISTKLLCFKNSYISSEGNTRHKKSNQNKNEVINIVFFFDIPKSQPLVRQETRDKQTDCDCCESCI